MTTIDDTWPEALPDADTNGVHDLLFDVKDYTKRIHWWIRLFGVVWLASIALAVLAGAVIGIAAVAQSADSSSSGGFSSRSECMAASYMTYTQCDALFPND